MDTSETYIKMCDCPEIQDQAFWNQEDLITTRLIIPLADDSETRLTGLLLQFDGKLAGSMSTEPFPLRYIWLPRQDQLQEMLLEDESYWRYQRYQSDARYLDIIDDIRAFFHGKCGQGADLILSLEQLWLAFVMRMEHSKVWNGEEWDAVHTTRKTPRTISPD
ncbi:hypothetical protein LCGC14_2271070 [marine sediment metagenome]|uniref:Uncharacterized protein n=1 Tax=marine sediment metagenome TaxID=412755 RepID=A0A0F9CX73_9ZZZZ